MTLHLLELIQKLQKLMKLIPLLPMQPKEGLLMNILLMAQLEWKKLLLKHSFQPTTFEIKQNQQMVIEDIQTLKFV